MDIINTVKGFFGYSTQTSYLNTAVNGVKNIKNYFFPQPKSYFQIAIETISKVSSFPTGVSFLGYGIKVGHVIGAIVTGYVGKKLYNTAKEEARKGKQRNIFYANYLERCNKIKYMPVEEKIKRAEEFRKNQNQSRLQKNKDHNQQWNEKVQRAKKKKEIETNEEIRREKEKKPPVTTSTHSYVSRNRRNEANPWTDLSAVCKFLAMPRNPPMTSYKRDLPSSDD